jgi:hypothetical protein
LKAMDLNEILILLTDEKTSLGKIAFNIVEGCKTNASEETKE